MEEHAAAAGCEGVRSAAMDAGSAVAEAISSLRGLLMCLSLYDAALQNEEEFSLYDALHFNSMQGYVLHRAVAKIEEACLILEDVSGPEIPGKADLAESR